MKTKALWSLSLAAVLFLSSCNSGSTNSEEKSEKKSASIEASSLSVDKEASRLVWKGEALNLYSHEGTINLKEADLEVADGTISDGQFVVDMTTITPTDENYNPEEGSTKEKLVGHLSSPDFFDVSNYPEATFNITGFANGTINGKLSIRGNTHEETVENVTIEKNGDGYTITGTLTFDRKKYDVSWDYPMKDRILSKDIVINITLAANA